MRRLLKFKYNPKTGEVFARYEKTNEATDTSDFFTFESKEGPRGSLKSALQKMAEHVVSICELPSDMGGDLTIRGVTLTYTAEDIQGLVITALRELDGSNAPMIINTPHFSREPYSETADDMSVFSFRCATDLDALEKEVFAYIDGERAQKELDFSGDEKNDLPEIHEGAFVGVVN